MSSCYGNSNFITIIIDFHRSIIRSGSIATVPQGWAACDGTQGTPDLRDRFILGSGIHLIIKKKLSGFLALLYF